MKKNDREGLGVVIWCGILICLLLMLFVLVTFKIKNMALYNGGTSDYNTGFTLVKMDGEEVKVDLPYREKSAAYSTYLLKKNLNMTDAGKTISFIASDCFINVYVDGKNIYSFGYEDTRLFGQTPGSVRVFANIPESITSVSVLTIELVSPYQNCASNFNTIYIGNRDQCILRFIYENLLKLFEMFMTYFCILVMLVFFVLAFIMKHDLRAVQYYLMFAFLVNSLCFTESLIGTLFISNQTAVALFYYICLFAAPLIIAEYFKNSILSDFKKALTVLQHFGVVNIIVQVVLQFLCKFDFKQMAFASFAIICVEIIIVFTGFYRLLKFKPGVGVKIEMGAVTIFICAVFVDILRTLSGQTDDLLFCTRIAIMIYALFMFSVSMWNYVRDLSGRYISIAQNLENQKKDAEEISQTKSAFLSNVSHEVRTPINAILGYTEMIKRDTREIATGEYAMNIDEAGKGLLAIFNDIMDYTGMEDGKVSLLFEEYSTREMLEEVEIYARVKSKQKNLRCVVRCSSSLPTTLKGDQKRITQIMHNLISNAVKYTNEGGIEVDIDWAEINDEQGKLILVVKDTGIGMKPENLQKITQAFSRFDNRNTRNVSGVGLGLSIVDMLLKLMDGKMEVKSIYGKGSTFTCNIGQEIVDKTPLGNINFENKKAEKKTTGSDFYAPNVRILAVDDNVMNLELIKRILKDTGILVDTALNGREALRKMKKLDYHLVIMDHMMPVMDGIEALHEMKKLELCPNAKVVVFTANAVSGERDMYLNEGFDDYLTKPVNRAKFLAMVKKYIPAGSVLNNNGDVKIDNKNTENGDLPLVIIVDDDIMTLRIASKILSEKYRTETAADAAQTLKLLSGTEPELLLLDIHLPDMSGFELAQRIRNDRRFEQTPIIFLTGDEDQDIEVAGFKAGGSDFIRKPFVAEVVLQRVGKLIELDSLRKNLASQVRVLSEGAEERKSRMETLSVEMMLTLAATIDAKDRYTNGHSNRVAQYSRDIARRLGLSEKDQNEVYYTALLHDIGKIGVPDAVISKTSKLTDEEYGIIKQHPVIGSDILKNISEMPFISEGARWHHERYDGNGYPDRLKGEDIPKRARIIAVADAYDAMTSNRSYRNSFNQSQVREEIVRCRGTQFDPEIADIMLQIIDEDVNFELHE